MATPISDAIAVHAERMAELRQAVAARVEAEPQTVGGKLLQAETTATASGWLPEEQAEYETHRRAIYAIRAEATAAALGNPPVEWQADGLTIRVEAVETVEVGGNPETVLAPEALELSPAGVGMELDEPEPVVSPAEPGKAAVRCVISAERQGKPVQAGDGVFVFVNPPVLVPDPNGEIVREVRDHDGALIETLRYREDPDAALRQA